MRLKRLELQGFKSFLDRTVLTFEPGITGVVGPNGCGKSNIVDAILWVMGEQSPKHLRGENMTDVIFAGSEHRAPTSMAEVSLVLDKQGVALSPAFAAFERGDEISITRRIYRDGTGEFLINKQVCRLKDIHELFMDTGVGRRAYSIIEQGQIDRMINTKPEDRRLIFEEVAGITKYKTKRKEAERKLEQTSGNLQRLQDILNELEKQIRSLKIQATRARKFKELKGELETLDLFLLGQDLFRLKKTIEECQARRDELQAQRSECDAVIGERDAEVTELDVLRLDQEKEYERLGALERDLMLRAQKLDSQISIFAERRKSLLANNESLAAESTELQSRRETLEKERHDQQALKVTLAETLQALEGEIRSREDEMRAAQERRSRAQSRRDDVQRRKNQNAHSVVALDAKRQNAEFKLQDLAQSKAEIEERVAQVVAGEERWKSALGEAEAAIEGCGRRTDEAKQEVSQVSTECQETSSRLSALEEELFEAREGFHQYRSRLQSLKELQENLEGYSPTAREILSKLGELSIDAVPLAELLQPEAELEEHLEILLGSEMNTLVVQDSDAADRLARFVEERGLERVKIVSVADVASRPAPVLAPELTPLLARIRVRAGYDAVASWCLGRAALCADSADVLSRRRQHPDVTLLGASGRTIAHGDGALSAGTLQSKMGVFARRREIDELLAECAKREAALSELTAQREQLLQHLQQQEKLQAQLKEKLSALHIESVEKRKEKEQVQIELSRAEKDRASLARETERCALQMADLESQVEDCARELIELQEAGEQLNRELGDAETEIAQASAGLEELQSQINERRVQRSAQAERASSIDGRVAQLTADLSQLARRLDNIANQQQQNERELAGFDQAAVGIEAEKQETQTRLSQTQIQLADTKAAFNETCERLQTARANLDELQDRRDEVVSELQALELKLTQEQSNFEHLRGISMERYQQEASPVEESHEIEIEKLPLLQSTLDTDWATLSVDDRKVLLREHLKSLREKVSRYGEVNLTAIQEFDHIQKRYDFLMEQRTDLDKSIQILQEAIVKIDESTKARFAETFDAVQKKFSEIFPILFGGGKGELVLVNAETNPLEAGVDIMVQPPGKRLQSISLLSGGEKAMTAVSLVLAIFARKPSPFCLLDEVDAPLDDANVSRFNTVVRKMAEKTQFIVITHNKKTMEIAEALYGVTMEKAGVSKMTSVRLN